MAASDGVVIALVGLLIAAFPAWPYSRNWGYYPSAVVSLILIVLLILLVARTV
jgi:peptidoglycan/LPS O-acetylase OafA/YrhL